MADTLRITVYDETPTGEVTGELTLDFLTERVTVRELIRSRVYQRVKDLAARPETAASAAAGAPPAGWLSAFEQALEAFRSHGILVVVGDRQVADLDEEVVLEAGTRVAFIRLVPLVGG